MTTFEEARLRGLLHLQERGGIGTLGERSLHAVLKYWIEPDESRHEVKLPCGLVADIYDGERVVEVQTEGLYRLRGKLDRLLPSVPVTVVVPVVRRKTLIWLDPETGEATAPRKSPRVGGFWDRLPDLYWLLPYLADPGLTIRLVELDLEESRARDGWGRDGKRGSHRLERVPVAIGNELWLHTPADCIHMLPAGLPVPFTTADLKKAGRLSPKKAGYAVNLLYKYGVIIRKGKKGNAYLYAVAGHHGEGLECGTTD